MGNAALMAGFDVVVDHFAKFGNIVDGSHGKAADADVFTVIFGFAVRSVRIFQCEFQRAAADIGKLL